MSHSVSIVLQPPLDALFAAPPTHLQTRTGTLLGVLHELCDGQARASAQLLNGEGLSPFVHVFLNGAHVPAARVVQQPVQDGDELCLLTAIRGG